MRSLPAAFLLLTSLACVSTASADGLSTDPASYLHLDLARTYAESDSPSVIAWGEKGSLTFNASLGYADDFEDIGFVPAGLGISWFPIKNFSLDVQLEGAHVNQPGDDAIGGGLAMLLRWHFLDFDTWTIYGDLGVGFLVLDEPVPQRASEFVFTPRAGVGASFAITDYTRLLVGVRWFHISNAETSFENPGIDALQGYVGVSFAF
jgi:Lipid A 3-O-deacylase (PagL)